MDTLLDATLVKKCVESNLYSLFPYNDTLMLLYRERSYRRLYDVIAEYNDRERNYALDTFKAHPKGEQALRKKSDALARCARVDQFLLNDLSPLVSRMVMPPLLLTLA